MDTGCRFLGLDVRSVADEVEKAVEFAFDCGYRHIDTAYNYKNEEEVGRGIKNWLKKTGSKREDLFIVTKLPMIGMYQGGVEKFLRISLKKLGLGYVDLYLIHTPIGMKGKNDNDVFPVDENGKFVVDDSTDLIAIWKEMEKMVDLGLTKSIGVSNFSVKQMRKIKAIAQIPPAVNQVEMNVTFQQKELLNLSRNDIVVTVAPLVTRKQVFVQTTQENSAAWQLLQNPVVKLISDKHNVSPAQVLLRYLIEKEVVVIPKSVNPERIKTNGDVFSFSLDETDNLALLLLDLGDEGRSFNFMNYPGIL
ncbi:1,5-anhydro-D-fructose reductase [Armadillidium vulgare]|nr:1,5-anhydro-D-fructose reductase [Armadillidium vulgare]